MAAKRFEPLPPLDEDALHILSRLLGIEARPYTQICGRLLKDGAMRDIRPLQLPSPPPDANAADEEAAAREKDRAQQIASIRAWQQDVLNEIQILNFRVLRAELTTNSNQAERARYTTDKDAITAKQQAVRDNIEELRKQLIAAKETKAIRITYDELTDKITSNKMLKTRDEAAAQHAKLDDEINDLEAEVEVSKDTWAERRNQFGRIEAEAREMLRMIKDEKEEAERKEGMMKDDAEDGEGSASRGGASQVGTPRPDGDATPMHIPNGDDNQPSLKVPQDRLAPLSRGNSVAPSPGKSGAEDTPMADSSAAEVQAEDSSGPEEGEEAEDGQMDES